VSQIAFPNDSHKPDPPRLLTDTTRDVLVNMLAVRYDLPKSLARVVADALLDARKEAA
jgi:hypothetical protein